MTTARDVIASAVFLSDDTALATADMILSALRNAPDSVRLELAALLNPCRSINPWRPIDEATDEDKDGYVLGFVMGTKLPMVALWDDDENRWFALNKAFKAEWNPTHFMCLPGPPPEDKT